jgi:hypothetical protein
MPHELECESERRSAAMFQQSLFRLYLAAAQRRTWSQAPSAGDQRSAEIFVASNYQDRIRRFSETGGFETFRKTQEHKTP